jgi:hypothetical protein
MLLKRHMDGGDGGQIFVHSPRFLEERVRWMCRGIAKFGKNMISIEEEESGGMKLMFTDGISAIGSAGSECECDKVDCLRGAW